MSTTEFQDRNTSRGWQRAVCEELIDGTGHITTDYFDHGQSRRRPWTHRPAVSALLAAAHHPNRDFDAIVIVIGEYERAFHTRAVRDPATATGANVNAGEILGRAGTSRHHHPGRPRHHRRDQRLIGRGR